MSKISQMGVSLGRGVVTPPARVSIVVPSFVPGLCAWTTGLAMAGGSSLVSGVHLDLERQRLLGASCSDDGVVHSPAGFVLPKSPGLGAWSTVSVRVRFVVSVVAGVCVVLGVASLYTNGGVGVSSGAVVPRLGGFLDPGVGRALSSEEREAMKTKTQREAAAVSAAALDDAFAFQDDDPEYEFLPETLTFLAAKRVATLGSALPVQVGDGSEVDADGSDTQSEESEAEASSSSSSTMRDRLGSAALGKDGLPLNVVLGKENTPFVQTTGSKQHDLNNVAAKLGAWGDCPRAFRAPKVGPRDDWSFSYQRILALADTVYVVCVRCDEITVPAALAGKTLLVDGRVFDECDQADKYGLDHYKRASLSHAAAVADAMSKKLEKVAVVEEDSVTPRFQSEEHGGAPLGDVDLFAFQEALKRNDWSFARLGWRQYTLEIAPAAACPQQCACQMVGNKLCFVAGAGCDLRSSDSYIISQRYFKWTLDQLIQGGTVDYDVLPRAPGTLLALPILSAQRTLDIPVEHQQAVSELFMAKCLVGDVPDFSSAMAVRAGEKRRETAGANRAAVPTQQGMTTEVQQGVATEVQQGVATEVQQGVATTQRGVATEEVVLQSEPGEEMELETVPETPAMAVDAFAAPDVEAQPIPDQQTLVDRALRPEERARALSFVAQDRI